MIKLFCSILTLALLTTTAAQAAPPSNDNIANALQLSGDTPTSTVDVTQATVEVGDFGGASIYHTVWWKWTAAVNGRLKIDSAGSGSSDLEMIAYIKETNGTLSGVVARDSGSTYPKVSFPVTAGTVYVFGLGTSGASSTGTARVSLLLDRTDAVSYLNIPNQASMYLCPETPAGGSSTQSQCQRSRLPYFCNQ